MTHVTTNHRHPYGNRLCPSLCRTFLLVIRGRAYIETYLTQNNERI